MPHSSTQLDKDQIYAQASKHEQIAQQISDSLNTLQTNVDDTLNRSSSEATKALKMSTETWVASVRKSVLEHMNAMAQNIRREADNQEGTDQSSMKKIMDIPLETGIFLGGH